MYTAMIYPRGNAITFPRRVSRYGAADNAPPSARSRGNGTGSIIRAAGLLRANLYDWTAMPDRNVCSRECEIIGSPRPPDIPVLHLYVRLIANGSIKRALFRGAR